MAFLVINPRYRLLLHRHGLVTVEDFLQLSGVIYCGHPDRHVVRVNIGKGPGALAAFLKKEHRVRWHDRLANAWAGFGLVSRSRREWAMGRLLKEAGIPGPEMLAAGECAGQAFLLVREVEKALDLRYFLDDQPDEVVRRRLARELGRQLARIHEAGLDHPDLYSKHVLVQGRGRGLQCYFLDWQRARRRCPSWNLRCRDLAALDATLTDKLASPRDRLRCLHAYLQGQNKRPPLCRLIRWIEKWRGRYLRRRHVRELRRTSVPPGWQNLIWLEGEALCVTRQFWEELGGKVPGWLGMICQTAEPAQPLWFDRVPLPGGKLGQLVRRWQSRPWRWLWSWFRGRPLGSPEFEQAATLFRLERHGLALPRLLALGQRQQRWRTSSFLLTELEPATISLIEWLVEARAAGRALSWERRHVFRQAGEDLRRLHEAGYSLEGLADVCRPWQLSLHPHELPVVRLSSVKGLRRSRKLGQRQIMTDLARLGTSFYPAFSCADGLRFLMGYFDLPRPNSITRTWMGKLLRDIGKPKADRPSIETVASPPDHGRRTGEESSGRARLHQP